MSRSLRERLNWKGVDPRLVTFAGIYFFFFLGSGIFNPYLNLHFARIGLSESMIGLATAALPLGGIVGPPLVASFVDARGRANQVVSLAMAASGVVFGAIVLASSPWAIVALLFLFGVLIRSVSPLMDAAAVQHLAAHKGSYGRIRLWGSLGFMVSALLVGWLSERYGLRPFLFAYVFVAAFVAVLSLRLPSARSPRRAQGLLAGLKGLSRASLGANFHRFAAVLIVGNLASTTHNTFFAVYLDELGLPSSITGISWVVAIISEVIVLWYADAWMERFGTRNVIALGLAAGALRWGVTALGALPGLIIAVQALHGLSFGAVWAGMVRFVALEVPPSSQASGQAVITSARTALSGVIGSILVGYLADVWSIATLYTASTAVGAVSAILMWTLVREPNPRAWTAEEAAGAR